MVDPADGTQHLPADVAARMRAAEDRLYPLAMVDVGLYQRGTTLCGLLLEDLRGHSPDLVALLGRRAPLLDRLPGLADEAGLSLLGLEPETLVTRPWRCAAASSSWSGPRTAAAAPRERPGQRPGVAGGRTEPRRGDGRLLPTRGAARADRRAAGELGGSRCHGSADGLRPRGDPAGRRPGPRRSVTFDDEDALRAARSTAPRSPAALDTPWAGRSL